jgi:hypothetical protein
VRRPCRRKKNPQSEVTQEAHDESYRLTGVALGALAQVQLVASDPAVVAGERGLRTHAPCSHAQDQTGLNVRSESAQQAVDRFVALAKAEVLSAPITGRNTVA